MGLILRHIKQILLQNFEALRISNNGETPWGEVSWALLLPAVCALLLVMSTLPSNFNSDLLVILSVFMGFLIGMLVPFLSFIERAENSALEEKSEADPETIRKKRARLDQYQILYCQVSFTTVLTLAGIVAVVLAIAMMGTRDFVIGCVFGGPRFELGRWLYIVCQFVAFYICSLNILNMLKILVSSNVIIFPEIKRIRKESEARQTKR